MQNDQDYKLNWIISQLSIQSRSPFDKQMQGYNIIIRKTIVQISFHIKNFHFHNHFVIETIYKMMCVHGTFLTYQEFLYCAIEFNSISLK